MNRLSTLALVMFVVFPFMLSAERRQTTVHVSTKVDPSGLQDSTTKERQKAVKAITNRLSYMKNVKVVGNSADATVTIVVTTVSKEPVWQPTMYAAATVLTPGEPLPEGTRPVIVARAVLTRGIFSTSFAEAAGSFRGSAAENLARSIDSWFQANARTLAGLP